MKMVPWFQMLRRTLRSASLLALLAAALTPAHAQTAPAKSGATPAASSPNDIGFSIESEMLTYRALESNSEAVACDVAAYLTGGTAEFGNASKGPVCTVKGGINQKASVIVLPSDSATTIPDFRLWRANMEIMADLRFRAEPFCPESSIVATYQRGSTSGGSTPPPSPGLALFTPAGSALSLAQNLIGMFASETSTSAVGGTIHDQAFMDGVARELRSFGVNVMMPSIFVPSSLSAADVSRSPFLSSLDRLVRARVCLKDLETKSDTPATAKADISQVASEIDSFLATFQNGAPQIQKPPAAAKAPAANTPTPASAPAPAPAATPTPAEVPPLTAAVAASPLLSILSADDLAQKLGADPTTGLQPADIQWKHVLLVKALESGGTVTRNANIFGTKIRYSGGSVGTYSLFTVGGDLECSGNVYAYGGNVPAKKFEVEMRHYIPDPSNQFIFQKGSCHTPAVR